MPGVNVRETSVAFGYRPQADVATKNIDAHLWRKTLLGDSPVDFQLNTEDDAADKGKDDEFPTANYLTNWAVNGIPMEAYLSSQYFTWLAAFSVGGITKTSPAAGAYQYVMVPQNPVSAGIDCPAFTYIERIRASTYQNIAYIGCAINDWKINLVNGPGRNNAKVSANGVGVGRFENPSTSTIPASVLTETFMNAGGASFTVGATNYVTNKAIRSLEIGWAKNINQDEMYRIGSGTQDGAQVGDVLEYGDRVLTCSMELTLLESAPELGLLISQADQVVTLNIDGPIITGAVRHKINIVFHKARIAARQLGSANGKVTVKVTLKALKHPSNGLFTVTTITDVDNIGL